jgi:hypothetical protein
MRGVTSIALAVAASITATGNGTPVNIGDFHGFAKLVLNSGVVNAGTNTIKLQHSDDGSTGWADTGDAFAAVTTVAATGQQELLVNCDKYKKFVRVVDTLAGGANATVRAVQLVGNKQYA